MAGRQSTWTSGRVRSLHRGSMVAYSVARVVCFEIMVFFYRYKAPTMESRQAPYWLGRRTAVRLM